MIQVEVRLGWSYLGKPRPELRKSIYHVHSSAARGSCLVTKKLQGEEIFYSWHCVMKVALVSRQQLGFANGDIPKPSPGDPNAYAWETCCYFTTQFAVVAWKDLENRYKIENARRSSKWSMTSLSFPKVMILLLPILKRSSLYGTSWTPMLQNHSAPMVVVYVMKWGIMSQWSLRIAWSSSCSGSMKRSWAFEVRFYLLESFQI